MDHDNSDSGGMILYLLGGIVLLLVLGGVITALPDIKRYLYISSL